MRGVVRKAKGGRKSKAVSYLAEKTASIFDSR